MENLVSNSKEYILMSESERRQFTDMIKYGWGFAWVVFNDPEIFKFLTLEDQEAIIERWTFEEKEYFSEEYGIDVFNLGGIS